MRPISLRALVSIAARNSMLMRRRDFVATYVQGELQQDKVVYCHAPPGYANIGADSRPRSFPGPCVFTLRSKSTGEQIILGCYVDDLFILHRDSAGGSLYATFTPRHPFASRLPVSRAGVRRTAEPLLVESAVAAKADSPPPPDLLRAFQSLVGALLYCSTQTWPDMACAVGVLCRGISCPTPALLAAAPRTRSSSSSSTRRPPIQVVPTRIRGHSDSDWAVRHFTTGWVNVALSSCEAEIVAAPEAVKEAVYLFAPLGKRRLPQSAPSPLSIDSKSAIDIALLQPKAPSMH
eukprot:6186968-Pleurochrysis_carterae.AAC.14